MSAVESWFAPAAVAEPLPKARPPRRTAAAARRKPRRGQARSLRVRASLVWMAVFALLLVGVVAVNVAVLRAHVAVNDLDGKITQLQLEKAKLASEYSSATAAPRVERAARRAHLIPAPGYATSYLDMVRHK
jgi:hypothetical protein